jgi:hypothetical protein
MTVGGVGNVRRKKNRAALLEMTSDAVDVILMEGKSERCAEKQALSGLCILLTYISVV